MRVFVSAGEPSGDRHAADLIAALRRRDPGIVCRGFGGESMREAGADLLYPLAREPIIGITAVLPRILFFRRLLDLAVRDMRADGSHVLVLVDYPGFNLRLAEAAHRAGMRTVYYIGPQIWAWAPWRMKRIRRAVDLMLVVFDFELPIYRAAGVPVRHVGHPLQDQLDFERPADRLRADLAIAGDTKLLGLFPGSRPSELERIFPVMLNAARRVQSDGRRIALAAAVAPGLKSADLRAFVDKSGLPVRLLEGQTHALMAAADLALVASGTATLETALLGTPQLVLYRTDSLTYAAARALVQVAHIGLVNVVAGREIAPEFIQSRCAPGPVAAAIHERFEHPDLKAEFAPVARELRTRLGGPGAAARAAESVLEVALGSRR